MQRRSVYLQHVFKSEKWLLEGTYTGYYTCVKLGEMINIVFGMSSVAVFDTDG